MAELEIVVYKELDRMNPTVVIQLSDGLVRRTFYNSLGQETLDKLGHVGRFSTLSQTGRLTSTGTKTATLAALWSFQPQSGGFYETFDNFSLRNRWNLSTSEWETGSGRLTHFSPSVHRVRPLLFVPTIDSVRVVLAVDKRTTRIDSGLRFQGPAVRFFRPNGMGRAI